MTITLYLNILFLICSWMKHSQTGMSVLLPGPKIDLLDFINFGLFSNVLKKQCDITLNDGPV